MRDVVGRMDLRDEKKRNIVIRYSLIIEHFGLTANYLQYGKDPEG